MTKLRALAVLGAAFCLAAASAAAAPRPDPVEIRTSDVDLFYRIYDASGGQPTGEMLERDYIQGGSDALRQFVPNRIRSGADLAQTIAADRNIYEGARACLAALPAVKARLTRAFNKLAGIVPDARFPPVTILIGRNNSGGTPGRSGVLIGLEVACRPTPLQPNIEDHLVRLIMHEYGHVQQDLAGSEDEHPVTVLSQSLVEGEAELIAELTTGDISNVQLKRWTRGREREIDAVFLAQADGTDLTPWFYNDVGTPEKPGDLGYWVGYRIAKAYYRHAHDKPAAMRTLLELKDPKAILVQSGWKPGDRS